MNQLQCNKNINTKFDYVIIGAGITGLYTCLRLCEIFPNSRICILEKNDYVGGRAQCLFFHDTWISLGAGIVRKSDIYLLKLLNNLNLKYNSFQSHMEGGINEQEKKEMNNKIREMYNLKFEEIRQHNLNFLNFLKQYFEADFVKKFIKYSEYTDYQEADVQKTIEEYPLDEILLSDKSRTRYSLKGNWIRLINRLLQEIEKKTLGDVRICLNQNVYEISSHNTSKVEGIEQIEFEIKSRGRQDDVKVCHCREIYICADLSIKNVALVNGAGNRDGNSNKNTTNKNTSNKLLTQILSGIGSVPFTRVYAYKENESLYFKKNEKLQNWRDKEIKINEHVGMIAYNDSEKATYTKKILEGRTGKDDLKYFEKVSGFAIDDFVYKFWEHGVHYYKPQNPAIRDDKQTTCTASHTVCEMSITDLIKYNNTNSKIIVLGEMVSRNQGWVEGCIESVDEYFDQRFGKNKN